MTAVWMPLCLYDMHFYSDDQKRRGLLERLVKGSCRYDDQSTFFFLNGPVLHEFSTIKKCLGKLDQDQLYEYRMHPRVDKNTDH